MGSVQRHILSGCLFGVVVAGVLLAGGCEGNKKKSVDEKVKALPPRYATLPPRQNLPAFMKGTIYALADVENKTPYLVSGYGLVVGLAGTGNNNGVPQSVRNYMIDEMFRRGFGSAEGPMRSLKPEAIIGDSRTALVEVYAYLPPGARAGQTTDAFVQAVTGGQTRSLARGMLYQTDLKERGVDPLHPRGGVNIFARAKGSVFVNPLYAVAKEEAAGAGKASLRKGLLLGGGVVVQDRPLWFRVRNPQLSVSRAIEARLDNRFNETPMEEVARTRDEGIVNVLVPRKFNGDWQHFVGVASHLYLDTTPGSGSVRAKMLVDEAVKPDALLQDISYCLEGIGEEAVPFLQPLYTHVSPEVAYAAARAGACIGDSLAEQALLSMGRTESHPFQFNAVKTLGSLPESPRIQRMLGELLNSKNTLVRVEAYKVLAAQGAPPVNTRVVRGQFALDQVPCDGEPLVFATRSASPRIAIFGRRLPLKQPIMFSTMNDRLTISSQAEGGGIVVFDRTREDQPAGVQARVGAELYEMLLRLGGGMDDGFNLAYSDLVGIVQSLADGKHIAARFVMQDPPTMEDAIEDAPPIIEPAPAPASEKLVVPEPAKRQ